MNRRVTLLVSVLVVLSFLFTAIWRRENWTVDSSEAAFASTYKSGDHATDRGIVASGRWSFIAARDRNDHSLTAKQCDVAFPELYREIDRSQAFWKQRQDHKLTDAQWGIEWSRESGLRAMIYNGQLFIVESRGLNNFRHWEERSKATLANINRAILTAREPVPNIEFSIKIDDNIHLEEGDSQTTTWCFSRNISDAAMEQVWLIPDFNFWAYPRVAGAYGDFQREAIRVGDGYNTKIPQLVWRGTQEFNPGIRQTLLNVTANYSWSNVHKVDEDSNDADSARWRIALPEHCRYKFVVHTEGTTWSGRLKYLLSCHSTVIAHPLTFTTHLYHLLKPSGPEQNFIQTQSDWSDLPVIMDKLLANPAESKRIADNAMRTFRDRYMTPAAQTCYFRRLFRVWAEMTPIPDPYIMYERADGSSYVRWRGMTFEEYLFHGGDTPG